MLKNLKELFEEITQEQLEEAKGDFPPKKETPDTGGITDNSGAVDKDDDEDDDEKDEKLSDHAPDGKGHYSADDLREIIDYVKDLIEKEKDEDSDEDDEDKKSDDIGDVGLDLIYEYADLLPETVINQIVDDLKDQFEIEDTMLESIVTEGSAFFSKSKRGPAAVAAQRMQRAFYKKNIMKIKKRNSKWRNSPIGKKIAALHKKIFAGAGKLKGKRVVSSF